MSVRTAAAPRCSPLRTLAAEPNLHRPPAGMDSPALGPYRSRRDGGGHRLLPLMTRDIGSSKTLLTLRWVHFS